MPELVILIAAGIVFAVTSGVLFLFARWLELSSTTGVNEFPVFALRFIAFTLLVIALLALLVFNPLAAFMVIAVWDMNFFLRRQMWRESLVWILALTTARNLPLAPSVECFAAECAGGYRWRVLRFARRLQAGLSLGQALAKDRGIIGGLLTRDGAAAVSIGETCGDLPAALLEAARVSSTRRPIWNDLLARFVYIGILIVFTVIVTAWYMMFIMPAMSKIFADFGAPLPPETRDTFNAISSFGYLAGVVAVMLFLLAPLALFLARLLNWDIPGLRGVLRSRHAPPLLRAMAGVVERQQPLAESLNALAKAYPSFAIRRRLQAVYEELLRGEEDWRSLARHDLLTRSEAEVLQAAAAVGNLPWAMRALADGRERREAYRIQLALLLLWPVAIVAIGYVVGRIVISCMTPLAELIQQFA